MAKKNQFLGVFENMEFEPYKFQEYPKVVGYRDSAKRDPIIVNDQREELRFISDGAPGAVKTREEELHDELEKRNLELELAKVELEKIKAEKEAAKLSQNSAAATTQGPAPAAAAPAVPARAKPASSE
jgi:hypothetical protein